MNIFKILLFLPILANAAPYVVSDTTTQTVTNCGVLLDALPKVEIPVQADKSCKYDVSNVTAGVHTIKMTYINIDPTWGRSESVTSIPLDFIKPGTPTTPLGLVIKP